MKKIFIVFALALVMVSFSASAQNYIRIDQENVVSKQDKGTGSGVTYLRAGKDLGNFNIGLENRTARYDNNGGINDRLEATVSSKELSMFGITPFAGAGHDFGNNTKSFSYGLVGAKTGAKIGPGYASVGVKTRVFRENATDPKQTIGTLGYAFPVMKDVAFNVGLSRSTQDIKEQGVSVGLTLAF